MFVISKEFKFEAAHRLYPYKGKCARIHGHSYVATVQLARKNGQLDSLNMVTDFGNLKGFKNQLDLIYDHKLILGSGDPLVDLLSGLDPNTTSSVVTVESSPTAEVLAKSIYDLLTEYLIVEGLEVKIIQVVVGETCTSEASYIPDPDPGPGVD